MSKFLPLSAAAEHFGYSSSGALRKSFERTSLPSRFLLRIGTRGLRVDVAGLEEWLKTRPAYGSLEAGKDER